MIHMFVQWFERKADFTADHDREHHGTVEGATPSECMARLNALRENHNLAVFTPMQILYIY